VQTEAWIWSDELRGQSSSQKRKTFSHKKAQKAQKGIAKHGSVSLDLGASQKYDTTILRNDSDFFLRLCAFLWLFLSAFIHG
jgi:hypothetical protein